LDSRQGAYRKGASMCSDTVRGRLGVFEGDSEGRLRTALTSMMMIDGFAAALRGEEIVRMDLGAIRKHWDEAMEHPDAPHVPLILARRFKREVGEKLFCQPLATSSKSGLNIPPWTFWLIEAYSEMGTVDVPVF
jgi:hypothetical protein